MSNAGREFRDNRWGDRLMLCSWGWTTCQLSSQIIITPPKKVVCKIDEVLPTLPFSWSGANPGIYWWFSHFAAVSSKNAAKKGPANWSESWSVALWELGAVLRAHRTLHFGWCGSLHLFGQLIISPKNTSLPPTHKQPHCLITHKDPELTQRDRSQTPCGLMNSPCWLLQPPLCRSLWKALTVQCGLYTTVEKLGAFSHLHHIKVLDNTEEQ